MIIAPKETIEILDSNIVKIEAGVDVWSAGGTYVVNSVVQVNGTINKKYRAIKDGGQARSPELDTDGEYWYYYEHTNYSKAFDELSSSKCTNADSIYYKFQISDIDLLFFDGLLAETIRIKITNNADLSVVQDKTIQVSERDVQDWFDWTYAQATQQLSHFELLTISYNSTLEIWIDYTGAVAEVGHIAYGRSRSYGLTLAKPLPVASRRGIIAKSRDTFGNINTRRKARYKRMKITCLIDSSFVDNVENRLDELADTPCIFVGDEREGGYKTLLIYGEIKDHDMPIGITKTAYQLEVEGYL